MLGGASVKFHEEASDVAPWRRTFRPAAESHGIDYLRDAEGAAHRARQAALAGRGEAPLRS
eukprot:2408657-Pyramimonas_sp.AAC.1